MTRRTDPRVGAQIWAVLGDAWTVLNVGAGTGSYEPADRYVVGVEPSAVMRSQRPPGAPTCLAATADTGTKYVVVCIGADAKQGDELAADLALVLPGGLVRAVDGRVDAVVEPSPDLSAVLQSLAPARPIGVSLPVPVDGLPAAFSHALTAMRVSVSTGRLVEQGRDRIRDLLLASADPTALTAFRRAVLGDLEAADPTGTLLDTLAAWLATQGSVEGTARRLGVHRHTVTNRMERVTRVTGPRIATPDGLMEYQLALRLREPQSS